MYPNLLLFFEWWCLRRDIWAVIKNLGCLGYKGDEHFTQLYIESIYMISHEIRIPILQPGFNCMSRVDEKFDHCSYDAYSKLTLYTADRILSHQNMIFLFLIIDGTQRNFFQHGEKIWVGWFMWGTMAIQHDWDLGNTPVSVFPKKNHRFVDVFQEIWGCLDSHVVATPNGEEVEIGNGCESEID